MIALLVISGQGKAGIAYGFKSGMSRFDVSRLLSDKESFVILDGERQTRAGPESNQSRYNLIYCGVAQ